MIVQLTSGPGTFYGGYGGGIFNNGGTVTAVSSTISNNDMNPSGANGGGGGIYNLSGSITLTDTSIITNWATSDGYSTDGGGGVFNSTTGILSIYNSTVSGNTSQQLGGGMFNLGTASLVNDTFSTNTATYGGGGIAVPSGSLTLQNTILSTTSILREVCRIAAAASHPMTTI